MPARACVRGSRSANPNLRGNKQSNIHFGTVFFGEELTFIFVGAELATLETARYLDIKPGAPILVIERRAETLGGMPVEFRSSLCDSRDYVYLNEIV